MTKLIINLLESCEKREFDKVVKTYLREIHNFNQIVITDGKDDIGIDIKVFDKNNSKIQYQLTVQKSNTDQEKKQLEYKIIEDLEKASKNYKDFGYSNKLIYFYSKAMTNKRIRYFAAKAFDDFQIDLEFIDANRIAEESEEYIEIQRTLLELNELDKFNLKNSLFDDEQTNLVFDLISFGQVSDFKKHIIETFILQSLFTQNKLSKEKIIELCKNQFNTNENSIFYEKLINKLQTEKKITKSIDKTTLRLSSEEELRIKHLKKKFKLEEDLFLKNLTNILQKYNQVVNLNDYINQLKVIYTNNFNTNISDILNNSSSLDLSGISREFINFIKTRLSNSVQAKELAKLLIRLCDESKFIQKICASKVLGAKTNYNRLETYINTKKRVFIDTSIAINAICYYYFPKSTFENYFYNTSKNLIQFARKNKISLYIVERYIWEVQNHVKEAFNILPFTNLPAFEKLGKSRNAFYNFYQNLVLESNHDDISFEDFLNNFGFKNSTTTKSFNSKIENFLSELGIEKIVIEKGYNIKETNWLFQNELLNTKKFKTKFALENDSIMVEFLADKDTNIHPLQPVFSTWDKTFFNVWEKYLNEYPNAQRWFMFTPSRLIDHYALLKFSINEETVSKEMLAIISDDIISGTHTLLDSIMYIFNPNDEVGLVYTNKLAEIRDNEILRIKTNQLIPPEDFEGEAVIDDIFFKLTSHYQDSDDYINLFKKVFTRKDFVSKVIDVLTQEVANFYKDTRISEKLFNVFDELIEIIKKDEISKLDATKND